MADGPNTKREKLIYAEDVVVGVELNANGQLVVTKANDTSTTITIPKTQIVTH